MRGVSSSSKPVEQYRAGDGIVQKKAKEKETTKGKKPSSNLKRKSASPQRGVLDDATVGARMLGARMQVESRSAPGGKKKIKTKNVKTAILEGDESSGEGDETKNKEQSKKAKLKESKNKKTKKNK